MIQFRKSKSYKVKSRTVNVQLFVEIWSHWFISISNKIKREKTVLTQVKAIKKHSFAPSNKTESSHKFWVLLRKCQTDRIWLECHADEEFVIPKQNNFYHWTLILLLWILLWCQLEWIQLIQRKRDNKHFQAWFAINDVEKNAM